MKCNCKNMFECIFYISKIHIHYDQSNGSHVEFFNPVCKWFHLGLELIKCMTWLKSLLGIQEGTSTTFCFILKFENAFIYFFKLEHWNAFATIIIAARDWSITTFFGVKLLFITYWESKWFISPFLNLVLRPSKMDKK